MSTTEVPLTAATLRGAMLSIALQNDGAVSPGYDFTAAIVQAMFVPEPTWEFSDAASGDPSGVDHSPAHWTVQVTYVQDFTPGSLARFLFEHAGESAIAMFELAAGQAMTAMVILEPGTFGGVIGDVPLATVELPCEGTPEVVD